MKKMRLVIFVLLLLFVIMFFSSVGLCASISILSPKNNSWHESGNTISLQVHGITDSYYTFIYYLRIEIYDSNNNRIKRDTYYPAANTIELNRSIKWTIPNGNGEYTMKASIQLNGIIWEGVSLLTDSITFFAENDTPSLSLVSPTSGNWYRSGATVPITVTSSDQSSGIDKIEIYVDSTKVRTFDLAGEKNHTGTYNWTATTTGSHSIYAKIYDNVGYSQTSETRYVYVDNSIPTISITNPANNSYYKGGETVDISVSGSDVGSGVDYIELFVDDLKVAMFSTASGSYNWTAPTVPGSHVILAKIYDKLGLTGSATATVNIDNSPPIISGVPAATGSANGYIATPTVTWTWNPAVDDETGIKEYQVYLEKDGLPLTGWVSTGTTTSYSHAAEDGATYTCRYRAIDNAGNSSLSENGSIKVDQSVQEVSFPKYYARLDGNEVILSWNPVADFSGIRSYQVALTDNSDTPAATEIQDAGNQTSKRLTLASLEKNYYLWVRGIDNVGNTGVWSKAGPFPDFDIIGPANGLTTNSPEQTFGLEVVDNQDLRYRVCYQSNGSDYINKSSIVSGSFTITFLEGKWKWWLEIMEYSNGSEEPGSKQTTEAYSLTIDRTLPSGKFILKSPDDPNKIYSEFNPANTLNTVISVTSLSDGDDIVSSGIKGVTLWNGIETTPPDSAVNFAVNEIPSAGIPWELPDLDGVHQINMLIEDNAGNTSLVSNKVALDRVIPGIPQNITHSYTNGVMTFKWNSAAPNTDLFEYRGVYLLPSGTEQPFRVTPAETKEGTYQIAVGLQANQPVIIKLCSVDRAANESAMVEYLGCTPAQPGTLEYLGTNYDTTGNKHYLTWKLAEPGIAATHILEYGQTVGEEFIPSGEIAPDGNGAFTHNSTGADPEEKLQPHATYTYRLVAFNQAGDRKYSPVFTQEVDNLAPVKPEIAEFAPSGYASGQISFDYPEVRDYDNDAITYTVKWAEGTSPVTYQNAVWNQELGKYTINLAPGKHGTDFSWYLEVKDSYGATTNSDIVQFRLDVNNPKLTLEKPKSLYTNLKELQVSVTDDLSGIKSLVYQAGDQEPRTVELTSGSGGELIGTIPLAEGSYNLKVTVQDHAGNNVSEDVNNLWVDHTLPVLDQSSIFIDLGDKDGDYLTSGKIPISWKANDSGSGIAGLRYWILSSGEAPGPGTYIPLSSGLTEYAHNLEMAADKANGQYYYLELAVVDKAGNKSETYRLSQAFLLDTTPPEVELVLTGLYPGGSNLYLTNLENLEALLTIKEEESGAVAGFMLIESASQTPVTTWDNWENVKQAILTPGTKYRVAARAINGVGLVTETSSEEFTFDNSEPTILSLTGPDQPLAAGESFILNVTAEEYQTSVVKYRIAIGAEPGGTEFTALLPGNKNGWFEINTNSLQPQLRLETPEIADGTYQITLEAVNAAGLTARFPEDRSLTVNNHQERIVVSDQGPYTMFADRLTGWWKYHGTNPVSGYRFRVLDINNQTVRDWRETTEKMVTVDQLQLENGRTYRFEVQAIFEGNLYSQSGYSSGVTVDTTIPVITELKTPLYTTPNNFGFDWAGSDDYSGISRVLAAVGTDYNRTDVTKGWVEVAGNSVTLSRDVNGEPLAFDLNNTKRYYLTLRLVNGAGLTAEQAAPAVVVDNTPPPVPVVYDQGGFINTKPEQPIEAHWFWSQADPESGCSYQWTILKYGEEINPLTEWHNGDDSKRISLTMDEFQREHGETYYFAVKATNGAGLSSIGYSDGIMADATAPYLLKVKVLDATNQSGEDEINYVTDSNKALRLLIDSYDPQSDVAYYLYAWNTPEEVDRTERTSSTEEPISITNPDLVEGAINIFLGETVNQADITSPSGYSTGIVVDSAAPLIKNVRGIVNGGSLLFDWDAETSVSPIVRYEYALVNEAKVNSITAADWKTAEDQSLDCRLTLDAAAYQDGNYCLVVRGYNAAGTYSRHDGEHKEWGVSNVIILDRTAPAITTAVFPKYADESIKFSASAKDEGSGIGGYQYALGTAANPFQFSGGWLDLNSQESTVNIEIPTGNGIIQQNTGVYAMVRVKDQAGLWSTPKVSGQIIIDHTGPVTPTISYGGYTTNKLLLTGIEYQATDPESGLANYRLGLATETGGAWFAVKEEPVRLNSEGKPVSLNLAIDAPGLTEAGTYYLALQVQNGTGDWSEIGYSGMITVDSIKPALVFSQAGQTLVINQPPLSLEYTLSEDADVKFVVTGADGTAKEETIAGINGVNQYIFMEAKPQIYTVTTIVTDKAGNVGETTEATCQTVRVNTPPSVTLPGEIVVPIGKPITMKAKVIDPDGVEGDAFTYEWLPGDGGAVLNGATPEYKYTALGQYTLTLTVTDKDGGRITITAIIKVENTSGGSLFVDETWSGSHRIYGDLIVPEGIKLTIQPGTQVIIDGRPGEIKLEVKGAIFAGPGVVFSSVNKVSTGWKGIYVTGQAAIEGVTISNAERGLVINGAEVTVDQCVFRENHLGVHVINSQPLIKNSIFENNAWYGVKEDKGGRPILMDCTFIGNRRNYYHQTMTSILIDQINDLPGNSGNK